MSAIELNGTILRVAAQFALLDFVQEMVEEQAAGAWGAPGESAA